MNIFYLAHDPAKAARMHCDAHVRKMILESAQMLCTVVHQHYPKRSSVLRSVYKPTHAHHPCTRWVAESITHAEWLVTLAYELNKERHYRWNVRDHASLRVAIAAYNALVPVLPELAFSSPPQCMDEQYRKRTTVAGYRNLYATRKLHLMEYTHRRPPTWLIKTTPRKSIAYIARSET